MLFPVYGLENWQHSCKDWIAYNAYVPGHLTSPGPHVALSLPSRHTHVRPGEVRSCLGADCFQQTGKEPQDDWSRPCWGFFSHPSSELTHPHFLLENLGGDTFTGRSVHVLFLFQFCRFIRFFYYYFSWASKCIYLTCSQIKYILNLEHITDATLCFYIFLCLSTPVSEKYLHF